MSFRTPILAACAALVLAAACGSNPELRPGDPGFNGGAGLGEACEKSEDCAPSLLCGGEGVCVSDCGEVSGNSCGREACLPSGRCSEGLGNTCQADDDCNDGLVCSERERCSVPCKADEAGVCKDGADCHSDGTCPTDKDRMLGLGGMGNEPDPGVGGSPACIDVDVTFEPQVPTVLLLIDRSGSMNADGGFGKAVQDAVDAGTYELGDCPSNNNWRWNVVRDVLMNPEKGIVRPLEDRVRFGLSLYTSIQGQVSEEDPEQIDPTKMCPQLIETPIALGNHQAMLDEFKCGDIPSNGDTPTGESLLAAAETLKAFDEPGPKLIVLATDGLPDTCECPDFSGDVPAKCKVDGVDDEVKAEVVTIAEGIHDEDITVHVINVSTPSEASLQQHLEDVAAAGGGEVYPGFSPGALSEAFEAIIDGVRSCVIDLDGKITPGKESSGTVTLDGEKLVLDDADGWQVNNPSQIELLGAACETIKSGDHDLDIKFPCESFDPVVQ